MKKPKLKKGWFYDICGNLKVAMREYDPDTSNNGDYHHHDWVGPYRSFKAAQEDGAFELKCRIELAERELRQFLRQPEPK